jgi:hypothetical protein
MNVRGAFVLKNGNDSIGSEMTSTIGSGASLPSDSISVVARAPLPLLLTEENEAGNRGVGGECVEDECAVLVEVDVDINAAGLPIDSTLKLPVRDNEKVCSN